MGSIGQRRPPDIRGWCRRLHFGDLHLSELRWSGRLDGAGKSVWTRLRWMLVRVEIFAVEGSGRLWLNGEAFVDPIGRSGLFSYDLTPCLRHSSMCHRLAARRRAALFR